LTLPEDVVAHLRPALDGGRWVFVTDDPAGHRHLLAYARGLAERRGAAGCAARDLDYGMGEFIDPRTAEVRLLTFLTVPASALSAAEVGAFLASVLPGAGRPPLGMTVIITGDGDDPRPGGAIDAFLGAVESGRLGLAYRRRLE
jgi:hypothetical protein